MSGWRAIASPTDAARPGDDVEDAVGQAGLGAELGDPEQADSEVAWAGLITTVLPVARAGPSFQAAICAG